METEKQKLEPMAKNMTVNYFSGTWSVNIESSHYSWIGTSLSDPLVVLQPVLVDYLSLSIE